MSQHEVDLAVYPDECDPYGHLNQASFLALFERARWAMLARGPGIDLFNRHGAWPAMRRAVVDYQAPAFPGDVLRFRQTLIHHGRTSFTMRQTATRTRDDRPVAAAEFVFVCIDRSGRPVPVPAELAEFMRAPAAPSATPQPESGLRNVMVNGVRLAVDVRGAGPALLLVHGYPLDHTIWSPQLDALGAWQRVAPDLRGMGRSDAPDLGYSMATYADDLVALLEALGIERAVVCGHSMGGYIVFEFLRRWRHRAAGVILVGTKPGPDGTEARRARDAAAAEAREHGAGAIADAMLPRMLAPETTASNPALARQVRDLMAATPVSGIVGALGAMRDRADSTSLLPRLGGVPVLVLVGAEDPFSPPAGAGAMAAAIPGARFVVIADAGHLPSLEQPAVMTAAMRDFLAGIG
ncbi:MAG TPA: alpha/beta fold hydrolase [Gemmatimonadales bacterium]|nr:alpha/beta fold hydrolase [Gemmatimonadales bacterium]